MDRLIEQQHADSPEAANEWINDLKQRSAGYFEQRLAAFRKQVRDAQALNGGSLEMLHDSARQTLQRLADVGVGVVILDECHHLMGHWGRILAAADEVLNSPVIIGLTATPPDRDGRNPQDVQRYDDYFGPVDYEVPVPAVVRDGFLAPYQDLVWFVKPTRQEMSFVADVDQNFRRLLNELCQPRSTNGNPDTGDMPDPTPPLADWLYNAMDRLQLPTVTCRNWKEFERRDPDFADAGRVFLQATGNALPPHVPETRSILQRLFLRPSQTAADLPTDVLRTVLDRYIRHGLRRSHHPDDQRLCASAIDRLRLLGQQVSETGSRSCASPVSRVLGYTHAKAQALIPILEHEIELLEDDLRAVIISDYEKTSAVSADVAHILNEEAGGAVAAFRQLVDSPVTNCLDPVLLTGSTILVDADLAVLFDSAAGHWLQQQGLDVSLKFHDEGTFHVVEGSGRDWCPRVYIQMVTQLFQDGVTRCLVGTRGLLGEGWDANRINVLIDLTTVTTSMTVNQLRGRSIRLDPLQPEKLANNWDIVCVAPEFSRGMDDYDRFCRKHRTIYGITDDGSIEKGVSHVHPALAEVHMEHLADHMDDINQQMLLRASQRQEARRLWNIGTPFPGSAVTVTDVCLPDHAVPVSGCSSVSSSGTPWTALTLVQAIGEVLQQTLLETQQISSRLKLNLSERQSHYVRIHPEGGSPEDRELFAGCLMELMSPLQKPRYIIPRAVDVPVQQKITGWLPRAMGRWFESRDRTLVMYHAIPASLAKNKATVDVFQRHWNERVSPGDAVYTQQGEGRSVLEQAQKTGLMPPLDAQQRECFL
ncbi:MAG: DEAD/DEAH box helicase family protein [Planctomycetaceae bacterium]